jgi:hypothetical protein
VMVTYYVTPFVSLFHNYLTHHLFCLGGIYITSYVTSTMSSLIPLVNQLPQSFSPSPLIEFRIDPPALFFLEIKGEPRFHLRNHTSSPYKPRHFSANLSARQPRCITTPHRSKFRHKPQKPFFLQLLEIVFHTAKVTRHPTNKL